MRFSFLVLALLLLPPSHGSQEQNPSNSKQNSSATSKPPSVAVNNQPSAQEQKDTSKHQSQDGLQKPPWWDVTWSTWGLVIVGLFGTGAAIITLRALNKQTKSIIRSERAWIMVQEPEELTTSEVTSQTKGEEQTEHTLASFVLRYRNEGKTPAWITEKRIQFSLVENLPPEPIFDDSSLEFVYPEPEPIGVGQALSLTVKHIAAEGVHVIGLNSPSGNVPILYGIIKYRDAFEKADRETRFGYQIKTDRRIERIHSLSYNRNT
jgi:hypothetical protein